MKTMGWTVLLLAISLLGLSGCNKPAGEGNGAGGGAGSGGDSNATSAADTATDTALVTATLLCGKCGEVKGSATCCVADAEICECGMHKGSALCCVKLPEEAVGKDICKQCGHVAEAGHHCDEDCETCADCGLHKGSPACCKLKS
jgi:hypothetical protein